MPHYVERKGFTFADVLIVPRFSDIPSRMDIDVDSHYLGADRLPVMSAPMDYVTGEEMAEAMYRARAYGVVSRFGEEPKIDTNYERALSVGIRDPNVLDWIDKHPSHAICVDVAHGDHSRVAELVFKIKETFPDTYIIAGNVATGDGFENLSEAGADAIRVGIGPGSACSTRENTGVGVPQLTAIMQCADRREAIKSNVTLIADGGIQTPGDIVKALAAGADVVMLGRLLAGHKESPGNAVLGMKPFRGMSSIGSNAVRGAPEGVSGYVQPRGPVGATIEVLMNYLRSGMSYVGARNLSELRERAQFIEISAGTIKENETRI